ncbi:MAG: hypothetical protein O2816_14060 [Planctomycetota bacterium]|nr:hypothetical protein [Planctomycetota bacterium]
MILIFYVGWILMLLLALGVALLMLTRGPREDRPRALMILAGAVMMWGFVGGGIGLVEGEYELRSAGLWGWFAVGALGLSLLVNGLGALRGGKSDS